MPDFLFELGCEELPAGSVQKATDELLNAIEQRLSDAGVAFERRGTLFTPRRMIVGLKNVDPLQPDQTKSQRGPALAAAFGPDGQPTKALEGFCRGQQVDVSDVVREGDYVWVHKAVPGRKTREIFSEILPEAIAAVQFPKTMRWANSTFRFARPIRWILASFDGEAVEFEIEGVRSGLKSRGHRFRSAEEFPASDWDTLVSELRGRFVEPDYKNRRTKIHTEVQALLQGEEPIASLVDENANLTEWPEPLLGEFKPEFLELPAPVLETVMAKHERFFPVRTKDGQITNQFVSVRNGGEEGAVRQGNAWVLNARFNDARFFFEEDKKYSLAAFLERTSSMSFQDKLGTVRQRADRLAVLAREVALWSGADEEEAGLAYEAGLYAKADLTTGLVSELDELQGVIGGEYAKREGFADAVCWAIASHYDLHKNLTPNCVGSRTAVRLLIADQLDKIAGFMGLGLAPSGSSDPFGLRRSVTMLIEAVWTWPTPIPGYGAVLGRAFNEYKRQEISLDAARGMEIAQEVFESRYRSLLDAKHDQIEASLLPGANLLDPRAVKTRLAVVKKLANDTAFLQTAIRPANIVAAAVKKGLSFDGADVSDDSLQSPQATDLLHAVNRQRPLAEQGLQAESPESIVDALKPLINPINAFFDSTMVMVEEESVRNARLKLLSECGDVLRTGGDWPDVVIEG